MVLHCCPARKLQSCAIVDVSKLGGIAATRRAEKEFVLVRVCIEALQSVHAAIMRNIRPEVLTERAE